MSSEITPAFHVQHACSRSRQFWCPDTHSREDTPDSPHTHSRGGHPKRPPRKELGFDGDTPDGPRKAGLRGTPPKAGHRGSAAPLRIAALGRNAGGGCMGGHVPVPE